MPRYQDDPDEFREAWKTLESANDLYSFMRYSAPPDEYAEKFNKMVAAFTAFDREMWSDE